MGGSTSRKAEEIPNAPKRKSGQVVTETEWEKIVVLALRGHKVRAIARMTGFHERTLRRFWAEGFQRAPWGMTPIRRIIEEEQAKARALRERIGEDRDDPTPFEENERRLVETQLGAASLAEKEAAKRDALEARTAEGQLVKLARGNVIALAGAAVGLVRPAMTVAKAIAKTLESRVIENKLNPEEGIAMLREIARYTKDVVETGHKAMEMERLLLGDPSGGGKLVSDAASMTLDEARAELGNAAKIHAAMEARGWTLVAGGAGAKPAEDGEGQAFDTTTTRTASTETAPQANDQAGATSEAGAEHDEPEEDPET